jgi:NAD(P)-dependent dehydrogenase (short-subunit alcohol dehydrogenase family)
LPYNCAKFAAVGFSEGLRAEVKSRGVKVVTIAPGLMRTGSYLNAYFSGDRDKESAWFGVGASMPFVTISGERAARQIVGATRRGEAERILTIPANMLARFHGLFSGATSDILSLVNRLILPRPSNDHTKVPGSETAVAHNRTLNALTVLGRAAAKRFLQPQTAGER